MRPMSAPRRKKPALFVAASSIDGKGVFAGKRLAAGTRIASYKGPVLLWAAIPPWRKSVAHTMYFSLPGGKRVIDGKMALNPTRFLNHSCAPNVQAVYELNRVRFYTMRRIEPGVELYIDYQFDAPARSDRRTQRAWRCGCAAAQCRGALYR